MSARSNPTGSLGEKPTARGGTALARHGSPTNPPRGAARHLADWRVTVCAPGTCGADRSARAGAAAAGGRPRSLRQHSIPSTLSGTSPGDWVDHGAIGFG